MLIEMVLLNQDFLLIMKIIEQEYLLEWESTSRIFLLFFFEISQAVIKLISITKEKSSSKSLIVDFFLQRRTCKKFKEK